MTWEDLKQQLGSCGPAYPATELMVRSIETGKRECPSDLDIVLLRPRH